MLRILPPEAMLASRLSAPFKISCSRRRSALAAQETRHVLHFTQVSPAVNCAFSICPQGASGAERGACLVVLISVSYNLFANPHGV